MCRAPAVTLAIRAMDQRCPWLRSAPAPAPRAETIVATRGDERTPAPVAGRKADDVSCDPAGTWGDQLRQRQGRTIGILGAAQKSGWRPFALSLAGDGTTPLQAAPQVPDCIQRRRKMLTTLWSRFPPRASAQPRSKKQSAITRRGNAR